MDFDYAQTMARSRMEIPDRLALWRYLTSNGCWEWTGHRTATGYGVMKVHSKARLTHRLSWESFRGPIPRGMQVLHHCDNPPCFNPEHLYVGSVSDNQRDRYLRTGGHKLRSEDVHEIRRMLKEGHRPTRIARLFGVQYNCIWDISSGRRWRWLV